MKQVRKIIFLSLILPFIILAESGTVKVNLGENKTATIFYEIHGSGKTLIALHRSSSGYLEPIFSKVDGWKRIYIDPPGIGNSSADEWIKNADDCLAILQKAITKIAPNEKFSIAGFSYFGYMARGLMAKMYDKVDGLVLICPVIYPEYEKRNIPTDCKVFIDKNFYSTLTKEQKAETNGFVWINKDSYEAALHYDRHDVLLNVEFWNKIKANNYAFSFDPDNLGKIYEKPVLLLTGLCDKVVGYKDALKLMNIYRRASLVTLDYASHNLPYEQNRLMNIHIMEWIKRMQVFKE